MTPASGLEDGQRVRVTARGFTPDKKGLGIVQCVDKGRATGQDTCNIGGILVVNTDLNGEVDAAFTVEEGPFGAAGLVCARGVRCVIAVTELTLTPVEFASAAIGFD